MSKVLVRTAALLVLVLALTPLAAQGNSFNIIPYYATGSGGDWWKYQYTILPASHPNPDYSPSSPEFTVNQTLLSSGNFIVGPWIRPDYTTYRITHSDATHLYLYDSAESLEAIVDGRIQLKTFIDSPFPGNEGMKAYFTDLPSATVLAGSFTDILVYVVLDTNFPENKANEYLNTAIGLPFGSGWAVTHVSGMARHIGEIINIDFDANSDPGKNGDLLWQYELADYAVHPPVFTPAPATWVLLGSGLLGAVIRRRWRRSS